MHPLLRRTLLGVVFGALVYAIAVAWAGLAPLGEGLRDYGWWALAVALGLSSLNYLLRFAKWELCLGWLGIREQAPKLGRGRSLLIYLAGLSMSVTPGKVGEILRSWLLSASDGIPVARTAPVVVADRLTDLVALVILSLAGIGLYENAGPILALTLAAVVGGVAILGRPALLLRMLRALERFPALGGLARRAEPLVESSAAVLSPRLLTLLVLLSVLGWGLECLGFWVILQGFAATLPELATATFLWAFTTLVGALSFLPGGLGATEGSLALLSEAMVQGMTAPTALAGTLLIRAATLWFGEAVGAIALLIFLRDPSVRGRAHDAMAEAPGERHN